MRLFELFNSTFPLGPVKDAPLGYEVRFHDSAGKEIEVYIGSFEDKHDKRAVYGLSFTRAGSDEVTGEGEEFKIFSTVMAAATQILKKVRPDVLLFSAVLSQPNRVSLYKRLATKLAHQTGFTVKPYDEADPFVQRIADLFEGEQVFLLFSTSYQAG
jgi:hypothetical protein